MNRTSKITCIVRMKLVIGLVLMMSFQPSFAQKKSKGKSDWSKVDFFKEYKGNAKLGGAAVKSLRKNPTFINAFTVSQATLMKGNNTKGADKAIFSEVNLTGIDKAEFQKMTNALYAEFYAALEKQGLKMTQGADVMQTDFVKGKVAKEKSDEFIGNIGNETTYESKASILSGTIVGYPVLFVKRDMSFMPQDKTVYTTSRAIAGNYYQKLSTKENYNLLSVRFTIGFAEFEADRGFASKSLTTKAGLNVGMQVVLVTPNGSFNFIELNKLPIRGNDGWDNGLVKTKDNEGTSNLWGIARSGSFKLQVDSPKYIAEVQDILANLQSDLAAAICEKL